MVHASRYRELSRLYNLSEWVVRWICQGREHANAGGFIERFDHEGGFNRSLTDTDALNIRVAFHEGSSVNALAKKFNVSTITIERILLGKTYRNVSGPLFDKEDLKKINSNITVICGQAIPSCNAPVQQPTQHTFQQFTQSTPIASVSSTPNLSSIDIFLIRTGYSFGYSIEALQIQFKLSRQVVVDIINGKMFPNLPGPKEKSLT